jgi:hypothetical protein
MLLIHLALADAANDEGYCWPSVRSIAKKCRLDERYTRKLLTQMVEDGFVERALNEGKRGTNVYLVRSTLVKSDTPVKKDRGVNKTGLSSETPSPLSSRTPEPSVEPSVVNSKATKDYKALVAAYRSQLEELGHIEIWDQWMLIRKKKGGVQSDYAFWQILRELFKFPARIEEGLERAVRSSWSGFEWGWVESARNGKSHNGNGSNGHSAPTQKLRMV